MAALRCSGSALDGSFTGNTVTWVMYHIVSSATIQFEIHCWWLLQFSVGWIFFGWRRVEWFLFQYTIHELCEPSTCKSILNRKCHSDIWHFQYFFVRLAAISNNWKSTDFCVSSIFSVANCVLSCEMAPSLAFIAEWNNIVEYKISENDVSRPTFDFFYKALESLLRSLNVNVDYMKENLPEGDADRTFYIRFCKYVNRLYKLSDVTFNFYFMDLINPSE